MANTFFAHSTQREDKADWEELPAHLRGVARTAAGFAAKFDAADWGDAAGLLHDLGKYSLPFQGRLGGEAGRVDHSTAGALEAEARWGRPGKLIAFCVAGHHAGLADGDGDDGKLTSLADRLAHAHAHPRDGGIHRLDPVWQDEIALPTDLPIPPLKRRHGDRVGFQLAFFTRMLFSCLVDADYLETERYYDGIAGTQSPRSDGPPLADLRAKLDAALEAMARAAAPGPVNAQRARILAHVRGKAQETPGLFSLTVPTGGGKTLTSLAFALDHAIKHGLDRVIYVIPFTSIVEQTAESFRRVLGDDAVLEHHSAFDDSEVLDRHRRRGTGSERGPAALEKLRLAMENWNAPVVVTTAVQFFESLFANRPSRCRKLHNIARSVVILDEAQTLPPNLLRPCVAAIDELALNYRTSVVLCTATQPALAESADADRSFEGGLRDVRELAPDPPALYRALRRVTVEHVGLLDDAALAERLTAATQALCIVNNRAHARALYDAIAGAEGARHLTTLMYPAHRSKVLAEIKADLAAGRPCRLTATSLIEAGVNVDFPVVYRAAAGIESIAQAAGRCNREGRHRAEDSRVVVFEAQGWNAPPELDQFAATAKNVLRQFDDPLSLDAVEAYFREMYWLKGEAALDDPCPDAKCRRLADGILAACRNSASTLGFPFETIAAAFRMIRNGMVPIIVPDGDIAKGLLRDLENVERPGAIARKLQRFTVSVPPSACARLVAAGAVRPVRPDRFGEQFMQLENMDLYHPSVGLRSDDPTFRDIYDLMM